MQYTVKKILIIRLSSLGDVLLTTPVLTALKHFDPEMEIHFMVKPSNQDILQYNRDVDKIIPYYSTHGEIKKLQHWVRQANYDFIIDLQANFRSRPFRKFAPGWAEFEKNRWHRWLYVTFKRPFQYPSVPERYLQTLSSLNIPDTHFPLKLVIPHTLMISITERVNRWKGKPGNPVYFIAPGSKHFTKRYPVAYWVEIIRHWAARQPDCRFIIVGGPEDMNIGQIIKSELDGLATIWNACGGFNLLESAALIANCQGGISNDSFLMHVSSALQVPVVAIFGSTTPALGFAPFRSRYKIIENSSLSCRPCTHIGRSSCPKKHFKCMNDLLPSMVLGQVSDFFSEEIHE